MVKKRIPTMIKIGPRDYKVTRVAGIKASRGRTADGEIDYGSRTIRLDERIRGFYAVEVLLHEIIHGVSWQMLTRLKESQVFDLGYGLTQMFLDNPDLLVLLTAAADERAARKARRKKR